VLGLEHVGSDESFFDLGGDSLAAVEICAQLAAETGIDLSASALLDAPTVERLAVRLGSGASGAAASPIVPVQTGGSQPPLFLVGDFMGRLGYSGLARLLGGDQPVWGLMSHGGTERRVPTLAARYVEAIRRVQPTGPYRLGGWCFSAVVAFEIAQQLHENAQEIAFLALLGVSPHDFPVLVAPSARRRYRRSHDPHPLSRVVDHVARARAMDLRAGSVYLVRKSSAVPRYAGARLSRRTRAGLVEADDFSLYVAKSFPGRVALFLAEAETAAYSRDPASDWRGLSTVAVDVHQVPGDRFEMLLEPHVEKLARLFAVSLAQALPIA
jgi:thioesterase domain-containing protein